MSKQQSNLSTALDKLFYQELRGKTVTPDQQHILEWAERRLKPALERLFEAQLRDTNVPNIQEQQSELHDKLWNLEIGTYDVDKGDQVLHRYIASHSINAIAALVSSEVEAQLAEHAAYVIGKIPVGHIPDEECCDKCDLMHQQLKRAGLQMNSGSMRITPSSKLLRGELSDLSTTPHTEEEV